MDSVLACVVRFLMRQERPRRSLGAREAEGSDRRLSTIHCKMTQYGLAQRLGKKRRHGSKAEKERWVEFQRQRWPIPIARRFEAGRRYAPVMQISPGRARRYDGPRGRRRAQLQDLLMTTARLLRLETTSAVTCTLHAPARGRVPGHRPAVAEACSCSPRMIRQNPTGKVRSRSRIALRGGDPKQLIYRFRRADIVTYNTVRDIIDASDRRRILHLTTNSRTTGSIVSWVNDTFTERFPANGPTTTRRLTSTSPRSGARARRPDRSAGSAWSKCPRSTRPMTLRWLPRPISSPARSRASSTPERTFRRRQRTARRSRRLPDRHLQDQAPRRVRLSTPGPGHSPPGHRRLGAQRPRGTQAASPPAGRGYGPPRRSGHPGGCAAKRAVRRQRPHAVGVPRCRGKFDIGATAAEWLAEEGPREPRAGVRPAARRAGLVVLLAASRGRARRIVRETGPTARAGAGQGGDVQAGCLGKAFEALRVDQASAWSAAVLVETLRRDPRGQPRSTTASRRRRTPFGRADEPAQRRSSRRRSSFWPIPPAREVSGRLHIDRGGSKVRGYLAVHGPASVRTRPVAGEALRMG